MTIDDFIKIRHHLHQNPEISSQEKRTKQYLQGLVVSLWPETEIETDNHKSIIFSKKSSETPKFHIGFRCELDALPIAEVNSFNYASISKGISHKCGHDGHMTILLRLCYLLSTSFPENCRITLIFQSAEETGKGAKEILDNSDFLERHPLDYVFALHNVPQYTKREIIFTKGSFTPSVISVKTKLTGVISHAAEPEKGKNPAMAISEIIQAVEDEKKSMQDSEKHIITSTVFIKMGKESYGTSAGEGEIGFTFRSKDHHILQEFKSSYLSLLNDLQKKHEVRIESEWLEEFPSVMNDHYCAKIISESADKLALSKVEKNSPFSWGEDYGFFTRSFKGAMFAIGAGIQTPPLHNPNYDFPDELIETGSDMFFEIIQTINKC